MRKSLLDSEIIVLSQKLGLSLVGLYLQRESSILLSTRYLFNHFSLKQGGNSIRTQGVTEREKAKEKYWI